MHRAVTIEMHLAAWQEHKGTTPRQRHVSVYDRQSKKKAARNQRLGHFRKNTAKIEND